MERELPRRSRTLADLNAALPIVALLSLVAVVCYQSDKLVYVLGIPPAHIASYWPSTAFLVGVLVLSPRKIWTLLIVSGLGAMALADLNNGVPIGFEIWITLGNLAETLVASLGISLIFEGAPDLSTLKTLARYIVFAVILVPFVSALLGAYGSVPGGYVLQWRLWFFADALAFLTVLPAILTWVREGREWSRKPHNYIEFAAQTTLLVFFGYCMFMGTRRAEQPALLYSLVPLLLWAALRLGLKGVSTSMVIVALLSIWGASHGRGPFEEQGPLNSALSLQLFLFFAAIPFSILAIVVEEQKRAQEVLRKSEERFRMAAQAGKMFAYEWDVGTGTIVRSEGVAPVLGIDEGALTTGQHILTMVPPQDRERLIAAIAKLSPEEPALQIRYRMVRSDGTVIWVERNSRAYFDEQGRMMRMIGMVADITARKLAEEELAQANDRLRLAMEAAKSVGWDRDVKSGRDTLFGELESMFGIPSEVFEGCVEDFYRYLHPDDREWVMEAIKNAMECKKPYTAEFRTLRQDGTVRWVAARGKFYYSPEGEPERMLGMSVDITERKLAEKGLRESEERLHLAAQVGKMYAFDWDMATDVVIRSAESTQILGLPGEQTALTLQQVLASVHPEDQATFMSSIAELTPENPNTRISFRLCRLDGSLAWLERIGHAFFDEQGKILRMVGMVADITERKLAEEALSKVGGRLIEAHEEERSRIARDLHDDIGQRLALLANDIDGLKKNLPDSAVQVRIRIQEQLKRAREIATNVQAISHRLHSSKLRYLGIVAAAKSFCQELSDQQDVVIDFTHVDIPTVVPEEISLCLFRIMQEALQNAVKHSGVRNFEVELRGAPDGIHLTVRDVGFGFDPAAVMNNRGLGLISMQERVNLVKGTLSIDSRPDLGTTIHVRVPLQRGSWSLSAAG
jgi:PAS domain S-box-containing protein